MRCPSALASPVARVGLAPLPDALDLGGAGEVIAVAWLLEPAALAGRLARLPPCGLGAVALARVAARVGIKKGLTVLAFTFGEWTSHGPASPQANNPGSEGWKEENGVGKSTPKKREEDGRRGIKLYCGEEDGTA